MKYLVVVDGHPLTVEIDGGIARVDGWESPVELIQVGETPAFVVVAGDARCFITAKQRDGAGRYTLWTDRYRFDVEAISERGHAVRALAASRRVSSGPAPVVAPMPGLIVRVNVNPGDAVRAGQGLVVMEAMKMENELRAAADGTVGAIRVTPGTAVEKGAVLIELV
jgi:pyruvate carboxylase subunit B